ncbi:MAG: hypothetical protein KGI19_10270 [Thaumarchaeota archaeon]|nr:hypothetical protein [Nitrososphaerota archaeon]
MIIGNTQAYSNSTQHPIIDMSQETTIPEFGPVTIMIILSVSMIAILFTVKLVNKSSFNLQQ